MLACFLRDRGRCCLSPSSLFHMLLRLQVTNRALLTVRPFFFCPPFSQLADGKWISAFINSVPSFIMDLFRVPTDTRTGYSPVPTTHPMYDVRVRPPSQDYDSMSLHSIADSADQKPLRPKYPRDVERASPERGRPSKNQARDVGTDQTDHQHITNGWNRPDTPSSSHILSGRSRSAQRTLSSDTSPDIDDSSATSTNASGFPPCPPTSSVFDSQTTTPRQCQRQGKVKDSDSGSELSASELMDLLTDLEPVVNVSTAVRPLFSPGLADEHVMRKRSLSNDREPRFR